MDSKTHRLAKLACALHQLGQYSESDNKGELNQISLQPLTEVEIAQQDLLDALAFLVATEKNTDQVTAVGMEEDRVKNSLRFIVALNGTVPTQNMDIIQQIINLIGNSQTNIGFESLFANILQMKRQDLHFVIASKTPIGMQRRLRDTCKLRISVPYDKQLAISTEEMETNGSYTEASHADHIKAALQSLRNLLESCTRSLNELRIPSTRLDETVSFITACYELQHHQCLKHCLTKSEKIPGGEKLYQQIQKLAQYRETTLKIFLGIKFIEEFSIVTVEAVSTTISTTMKPPAESLERLLSSFTEGCSSSGCPSDKNKERMFRILCQKPLYVHAEVELAVHLMSRSKTPTRFIGCSRLPCFLCNMFLHYSGKFRARDAHRKQYTGWMIPNNPSVLKTLLSTAELICQSLEESLSTLTKRKYIQRQPLKPDPVSRISKTDSNETLPKDTTASNSSKDPWERIRGIFNQPMSLDEALAPIFNNWPLRDSGDEHSFDQVSATANQNRDPGPSTSRRICAGCNDEEAAAPYPCPHCRKSWYCNKYCMKHDNSHKFSCTIPPTSANYLVDACFSDLCPENDAFRDYGFATASAEERSMLLGLYQRCTKLDVDAEALHEWWTKDILAEKICETFESIPLEGRGGYYEWFLSNKDIVSRKTSRVPMVDRIVQKMQSYLPLSDRGENMKEPTPSKYTIGIFYGIIQCGFNPGPGDRWDLWRIFGFFACSNTMEEHQLALFYKQLFDLTTFEQFHEAYLTGSLDRLADNVGLNSAVIHWKSRGAILGLHPQRSHPSVYRLIEFALSDNDIPSSHAVKFDYGFHNCKTSEERALWKEEFANLFKVDSCNLIGLHEACIKGKTYDYMKKLRPETPAVLKRLTKNLYPLSDH
ncbi:hypothetical protein BZA77DRAFT_356584 [Pyronema omphalodes]|nr:hypothetical protein BZA77DRAFT_356584 [Pyronema omphalodes]